MRRAMIVPWDDAGSRHRRVLRAWVVPLAVDLVVDQPLFHPRDADERLVARRRHDLPRTGHSCSPCSAAAVVVLLMAGLARGPRPMLEWCRADGVLDARPRPPPAHAPQRTGAWLRGARAIPVLVPPFAHLHNGIGTTSLPSGSDHLLAPHPCARAGCCPSVAFISTHPSAVGVRCWCFRPLRYPVRFCAHAPADRA